MQQATYKKEGRERLTKRLQRQNLFIAMGYQSCDGALLELFGLGITVMSISVGESSKPQIWVHPHPLCATLNGLVVSTNNDPCGRYLIKQTTLKGCFIKWQEQA